MATNLNVPDQEMEIFHHDLGYRVNDRLINTDVKQDANDPRTLEAVLSELEILINEGADELNSRIGIPKYGNRKYNQELHPIRDSIRDTISNVLRIHRSRVTKGLELEFISLYREKMLRRKKASMSEKLEYEIRPSSSDDLEDLLRLENHFFREVIQTSRYDTRLTEDGEILVLVVNGKVEGAIWYEVNDIKDGLKEIDLIGLYVNPSLRNTNLRSNPHYGYQLIWEMIKSAEFEADYITLDTNLAPKVIEFYSHIGFILTGDTVKITRNEFHKMMLPLSREGLKHIVDEFEAGHRPFEASDDRTPYYDWLAYFSSAHTSFIEQQVGITVSQLGIRERIKYFKDRAERVLGRKGYLPNSDPDCECQNNVLYVLPLLCELPWRVRDNGLRDYRDQVLR